MHTNVDYAYQLESERSTTVRILGNRKTYNHRISDRITDNRTQQGKVTRTSDTYYSLQLYQEKLTLHSLRFKKNYCKNTPIQNTNFVQDSHGLWPVEYIWFESHISFSRATEPVKIQLQLTWLQIKGSSMRTKEATLREDVCKSAPQYVECVTNDSVHERKSWLHLVKVTSN